MDRRSLTPNTTLFPVPVVLITSGRERPNVMTLNRISSCNAEPPMLAISVRPIRTSYDLIEKEGEFVVNLIPPEMEALADYVGVTSGSEEDKWRAYGLTPIPASEVGPPLIRECPINLECRVVERVRLPSHSIFIGEVVALHVLKALLDPRDEVDLARFEGLAYAASVVRERPVAQVDVDQLRRRAWRG